jgi:type IV pilus assembly protein PilP
MFRNAAIIRTTVGFICFAALFLGCSQQAEAPPKPKIVAKKIIVPKKEGAPASTPQKVSGVTPETSKPALETKAQAKSKPMPAAKPVAQAETMTKPPAKAASEPAPKAPAEETAVATAVEKGVQNQKPVAPAKPSLEKLVVPEGATAYQPEGKLDPFAPLFEKEVATPTVALPKKKIERRVPRTPLEKVDLSQLKLVGVILSSKGNKALVEEASGRGYVVAKGTYIGNRNGKIVDILNDRIIVAEEVEDIYGNVSVKKRPLQIQKPRGE